MVNQFLNTVLQGIKRIPNFLGIDPLIETEGSKERQIFDNNSIYHILGFDACPAYRNTDWKVNIYKNQVMYSFNEEMDPGVYYLALVPDNIELWFAQNNCHDTHCIVPYVRSNYSNRFMLVEKTQYPYIIFKGQFKVVSQAPGSKGLSLIFDCPNYLLCNKKSLSTIHNIQLTLFTSGVDIIETFVEEHKYFIKPILDDTITVKHRTHEIICETVLFKPIVNVLGVVKAVEQHTNAAMETQFYTIVVEAVGITITVIPDFKCQNKIPEVNDIIRADGWLMGTFKDV